MLMKDQVVSFLQKGFSAAYVVEVSDDSDLITEIHEGKHQVLLFSPESLLRDETWREMLQLCTIRKI